MEKLLTFNSSASRMEPEWLDIMNFSARLSCSIIGFVSNLIIIFIIGKINEKMSRMDKMIMILSINNLLFLTNSIVQQFVIRYMEINKTASCLLLNYELALFMSCVMAILVTLSNNILKNERMSDNELICLFYLVVIIFLVLATVICYTQISIRFLDRVIQFCFFVAVGVLIRNEFTICWKHYNKEASCPDAPLGMNFARIFVFNYLITIILCAIFNPSPIIVLTRSTTFITSFYFLLYLFFSNKKFKFCFLNSLGCRSTEINNDILDDEDLPTLNA